MALNDAVAIMGRAKKHVAGNEIHWTKQSLLARPQECGSELKVSTATAKWNLPAAAGAGKGKGWGMSVNVDGIVETVVDRAERVQRDIWAARHAFPRCGNTVEGPDELRRIGGRLYNFLMARGVRHGEISEDSLDIEVGSGLFWQRLDKIERYAGIAGVLDAVTRGTNGGCEAVLDAVTELVVREYCDNIVGNILDTEVAALDFEEVRTLALQLQKRLGLEDVSVVQIMNSWEKLFRQLIWDKLKMRRQYIAS